MIRRQPHPHLWLMTDPRMGEDLWDALKRLPEGAGVVFRHYGHPDRRKIYDHVRRVARRRRLILLLAGSPGDAIAWRADGSHGWPLHRRAAGPMLRSASAHNIREVIRAQRAGADIIFLSPIFPTRSHPDGRALGPLRFGLVAKHAKSHVIALGGMNARRGRRLRALGASGWAGIDAWTGKRGAVGS